MADLLLDEVVGIGRLPSGGTLRVPVAPGAPAAALNLTVTWPRESGYLTVWPCDQPRPLASNLNYTRHQTVANLAITRLAADGSACVYSSKAAHVVVDLEGTFGAEADLTTVNPVRVLDTRTTGPPPGAGATVTVAVAGAGVPAGAAAVVATVTATGAAGPGFVTVWPCDEARPTASTLGYDTGATVAGMAITPPDRDGRICVYTLAPADLVVDVAGWFGSGTSLDPVAPTRLADTRLTGGRLPAGGVLHVPVGADAGAVAVTVTATGPAGDGYLTAFPCGTAPPVASTVNYLAGATVANVAVVGSGPAHDVCVTSYAPSDVVVDLASSIPPGGGYTAAGPVRLADTRAAGAAVASR